MRSLDRNGRMLEEVVEELLKDTKELEGLSEPVKTQVKIQRLKGEMRKYLNRPKMYAQQIAYIKNKINELDSALKRIIPPSSINSI